MCGACPTVHGGSAQLLPDQSESRQVGPWCWHRDQCIPASRGAAACGAQGPAAAAAAASSSPHGVPALAHAPPPARPLRSHRTLSPPAAVAGARLLLQRRSPAAPARRPAAARPRRGRAPLTCASARPNGPMPTRRAWSASSRRRSWGCPGRRWRSAAGRQGGVVGGDACVQGGPALVQAARWGGLQSLRARPRAGRAG